MKTPQAIINESGYPLQILIEHLVNASKEKHNWSVISREYRWFNPENQQEGFIDLLQEYTGKVLRMVIECKRYSGSWIFITPESEIEKTKVARVLHPKEPEFKLLWTDERASPESHKSSFCVLETEGKRDNRTLEKIAGEVLVSLESVAKSEVDIWKKKETGWRNKVYIPVIVTTADIKRIVFNEIDVDIENGNIFDSKSEVESVPYIRFAKSITTSLSFEYPKNFELSNIHAINERMIFIVQAKHFIEFLKNFSMKLL